MSERDRVHGWTPSRSDTHAPDTYSNPLVFVGGSQRSGTTLIQTWLCNVTNRLPVLPEAHIIRDQLTSFRNARKLWNKSKYYFASRAAMDAYYKALIMDLISRVDGQRDSSNAGIVLKDPHFSTVAPEIDDLFDNAQVVCCVRDPRDVVCSKLEAKERGRERRLRAYERHNTIRETAEAYRRAYECLDPGRADWHVVYYERFVEAPWDVIEALAFSLGLPVVNRRVETFEWLAADDRHQSAWITELEGSAPSSSEVGKFRNRLRGHEIARIEWTCRDAMAAFGYAGSGKAEKWKKLMRLARNRGV